MNERRHLFKRVEVKNGKQETRWYYWYYDENGKQVKRTCGQFRKPCRLKREAEAYLAYLEEQDKKEEAAHTNAAKTRLREVGESLYDEDSVFMKLRAARGRAWSPQTRRQKQRLMKIVLDEFGERTPGDVDESEIENFLISLDYKNAYKNTILSVMRDLFKECKRLKLTSQRLDIEGFTRTDGKKKDILTMAQLGLMFPDDAERLADIWSVGGSDRYIGVDGKAHRYGFMFGVMFRLMASTGLRPGEARAICLDQIQDGGLFINRMIDSDEVERPYLKKGSAENPKQRTVLLPSKMAELLDAYIRERPICERGYIFSARGSFIKQNALDTRFKKALKKLGIYDDSKIITPDRKSVV